MGKNNKEASGNDHWLLIIEWDLMGDWGFEGCFRDFNLNSLIKTIITRKNNKAFQNNHADRTKHSRR